MPTSTETKLNLSTTLPLLHTKNLHPIPQLGFGVYQSPPEVCKKSCLAALSSGYRHIDTAQYYANESQVGEALKESGIPRSSVFVTSKILSAGKDVDESYRKIVDSVEKIGGGYVDLFLIHSPNAGKEARENMWRALEKARKEEKVKAIGVSNYGREHIEEMKEYAETWPPSVNQIEVRVFISNV
jgi:diketogulonate reductase-like aldo/keto reductase